ncbi:MAG: hypothetical protein ACFFAY_08480 [Promethearchaeota archaeon]
MTSINSILLDSFKNEVRQARAVISRARLANSDFAPKEGMRSLADLVNHLAQIPLMDPAVYSSELKSDSAIQKREKELYHEDIDEALSVFDEGIKSTMKRFSKMSEADLLERNLQPFYEVGEKRNWAYYIPEMTRHIAMHKMQLWMYLKLIGLGVTWMTYYGVDAI